MLHYRGENCEYTPNHQLDNDGYEPVLWPSPVAWSAILRGAASQAGLDERHTLMCHLARRVASRGHVPIDVARNFVHSRIAFHVQQLGVEFGLDSQHATVIANRVYRWLASLDREAHPYPVYPTWPTPAEWLAIDRGAAWHAGLGSDLTISTTFARIVARRELTSFAAAKHWVHARIASHASRLAREFGYGIIAALVVNVHVLRWLESFDRT